MDIFPVNTYRSSFFTELLMHYFKMGNPTNKTGNKDLELTSSAVRKPEGTSQLPLSQQWEVLLCSE